jgi:hypothetical protein
MTVPFRTFALFGVALGMLAGGYLFAPAPGASKPLPVPVQAKAVPPPAPKAATSLVANRPPVPILTQPRTTYFTPPETAASDSGATGANPPETTQALAVATPVEDASAKRAIEFDGYRNVRGLTKDPDGTWHGRAMRGRTEIAVRVDASGSVSAE